MNNNWLVINFNNKNFLKVGSKVFRCQIGEKGFSRPVNKTEGDKTTPIGKWYFNKIFFRHDKILRPKFKNKNTLKTKEITKNCGWCDDVQSNSYNKYIKISNLKSPNTNYEKLWRDDDAYDVIIVISHNVRPIIKNKGSAIFIHCSFSDKRNTAGCIALQKKNLLFLLKNIQYNTYIKI